MIIFFLSCYKAFQLQQFQHVSTLTSGISKHLQPFSCHVPEGFSCSHQPASGPTKVCRGLQQRSKEYCWLKQPAATPTGGCETSGEASFFNVMSHAAKFMSCSLKQCFFMRDSMHEKYEPSLSLVRFYLCSLGYRTITAHGS